MSDYPIGGAHEDELFASLISLADSLVEGFDVIDLADRLMGTFQDLLRVTSAGIMLHDPQGGLQVIASTSEEMRLLELLEIQSDEGPCLTAFDKNEIVIVHDLADAVERWPAFAPQARAQGYQSAYSLPMTLRDLTVGAVNLFSSEKSALSDRDLQVAHVLTSMATIGLVNHRANRHQEMLAEQLQVALESRVTIEQAKGIIAASTGVDMATAFTLLRTAARAWRRPLSAVAADLVKGTISADRFTRFSTADRSRPEPDSRSPS